MSIKNWIKYLLIRKGSKIVTIEPDIIDDVQTVTYKFYGRVTTKEWNSKVSYKMDDIRFATRAERKTGKRKNVLS